jgi:hypothetical protein
MARKISLSDKVYRRLLEYRLAVEDDLKRQNGVPASVTFSQLINDLLDLAIAYI